MNKGWTEIIYNSKAKQKKNLDAIKILAWDSMYKAHHEDSFNNLEDYPTSAWDMIETMDAYSACVAPLMLNFTKIFRKNLKKPLDIDDKCITLEKQTTI